MIRALLLFLALSGTAMAKPLNAPPYDPFNQRVGPDGTSREQEAPPSKSEMFLFMWRQQAGDKPIPDALLKKYGLPPSVNNAPGQ